MDFRSILNFVAGGKITGLPQSTANGEPVVHEQLTAAIEGIAWKDSARVASQVNVNLAAPGANIDGIAMAAADRVLVKAQTAPAENGIYIWNGAAVPMTRAPDASTSGELEAARVTVEEGTSAGTDWRQSSVNFVLDTGAVNWTAAGTSAPAASQTVAGVAEVATVAEIDTGTDDTRMVSPLGLAGHANRKRKAVGTLGDGAATSFPINHNFNTRDLLVEVYRNSGNFDTVMVDVQRTSVNQVTVVFAQAPTAAQFAYVILA